MSPLAPNVVNMCDLRWMLDDDDGNNNVREEEEAQQQHPFPQLVVGPADDTMVMNDSPFHDMENDINEEVQSESSMVSSLTPIDYEHPTDGASSSSIPREIHVRSNNEENDEMATMDEADLMMELLEHLATTDNANDEKKGNLGFLLLGTATPEGFGNANHHPMVRAPSPDDHDEEEEEVIGEDDVILIDDSSTDSLLYYRRKSTLTRSKRRRKRESIMDDRRWKIPTRESRGRIMRQRTQIGTCY